MRLEMNGCRFLILNFLQMGQVALQDVALQAKAGKFSLAGDFDQPRGFQFFHMMRQGGSGDWLTSANISAGGSILARTNLLQNLMTPRIGQRLRDQMNLLLGKCFLLRHGNPRTERRDTQTFIPSVSVSYLARQRTQPYRTLATMRAFR